eukprot:7084901-Prymnesium_polylepis.1
MHAKRFDTKVHRDTVDPTIDPIRRCPLPRPPWSFFCWHVGRVSMPRAGTSAMMGSMSTTKTPLPTACASAAKRDMRTKRNVSRINVLLELPRQQ